MCPRGQSYLPEEVLTKMDVFLSIAGQQSKNGPLLAQLELLEEQGQDRDVPPQQEVVTHLKEDAECFEQSEYYLAV